MLPVAVPGLITTALFTFFTAWNEFFAALILISDQAKFTLPVALTLISSGTFGAIDWGLLQAGVATTIIPCIVDLPAAPALLRRRAAQRSGEAVTGP